MWKIMYIPIVITLVHVYDKCCGFLKQNFYSIKRMEKYSLSIQMNYIKNQYI